MAQPPADAPRFVNARLLLGVLILALALFGSCELAGAASSKASVGKIRAHLTKTSFKRSRAGSVKLIYSFSAPSKSFSYRLSVKKGSKWRLVKSVKKKGNFKGTKKKTVKKLFAGKPIKVGRYKLKLSADGGSKTLSFKVVKGASGNGSSGPINTALPTISGHVVIGQTLTASNGSWTNSPSSYAHQWRRCNSTGNNCSNISGAGSSTYALVAADVASTIRVVVTASNSYGSASAASDHTAVAGRPPVNTSLPTVSGLVVIGQTLTASNGSWANAPSSFTYQWERCNQTGSGCTDLLDATSSTYKVSALDVGRDLILVVTAKNSFGSASASSKVVLGPVPISSGGSGTKEDHTCAISANGSVSCWGSNTYGQLGNGSKTDNPTPVQVSGITKATDISASTQYTCARLSNGTVWCWGWNEYGTLGNGTRTDSSTPVQVSGITNAVAISAGVTHACALLSNGTVKCWGANWSSQLGDGSSVYDNPTPVVVNLTGQAVAIDAGWADTCAILSDHTLWCWGDNTWGQRGSPTAAVDRIDGVSNVVGVAAAQMHTCALLASGVIDCWGDNTLGQLGNDAAGSSYGDRDPSQVQNITNAVAITASSGDAPRFTCALLVNHSIDCWGDGNHGTLGDGNATPHVSATPLQVGGISTAAAVAAGGAHACALLTNGAVDCWGWNGNGELGNGEIGYRTTPVTVSGISTASAIGAGTNHTCAVLSDGSIKCWGSNDFGQLGNGSANGWGSGLEVVTPVTVTGISTAEAVSVANDGTYGGSTCVLLSSGAVDCWGWNNDGQLGNGTETDSSTPVAVNDISSASAISVGGKYACALLSGGSVKCWGNNSQGQLGDGSINDSSTPVAVKDISNAIAISAGKTHACAVLTDKSVWCWGRDTSGQVNSASPTQIAGISDATSVAAGWWTCATLSSGKVACFGGNGGSTLLVEEVSGIASATTVSSDIPSCALLLDGTIKCWGFDSSGELGNGTTAPDDISGLVTEPVTVSGITSATAISAGTHYVCALLSGGTVNCWGDNLYGQLGNGEMIARATPVSVIGLP